MSGPLAAVVLPDARAYDAGPFWLLHPESRAAVRWLMRHASLESTWHRGSLVVEGRYVSVVVVAMRDAGLLVEGLR